MASQITHVVYGKKIFDNYLDKDLSWPEFLVGTVFPDIHYIAKINRNFTHKFNTSKKKIPKNTSFKAGMYTHSYVDEKREEILEKKEIYDLNMAKNWIYSTALKLVEDEIMYDKYRDWDEAIKIFDTYFDEEYEYVPNKKVLEEWHDLVKKLFRSKPDAETWRELMLRRGIKKDVLMKILKQMELVRNDRKMINILSETYEEI